MDHLLRTDSTYIIKQRTTRAAVVMMALPRPRTRGILASQRIGNRKIECCFYTLAD